MSKYPMKTVSGSLDDEIEIVAMCRALNDCAPGDLDQQIFRTLAYLRAGIVIVNWKNDKEALNRQHIRRNLIIINRENNNDA